MKLSTWMLTASALLLWPGVVPAGEEAKGNDPTRDIARALEKVVQRGYPEARLGVQGTRITMEHDARTFLVHHLNKKLEWMDAVEERGPRGRGVVLQARYVKGPYRSALATGVFDERYYQEHRMVRYEPQLGHHLHVVLRLPARSRHPVPEGFADRIEAFVAGFAEHVAE